MIRENHINLFGVLLTVLLLFVHTNLWAVTEIYVETAGTLQSLLTSTEQELKVTGVINGSDIKYIRQLVTEGTVKKLDWSGVCIPTSIGNDFTIYSVDADGTLHEMTKAGNGTETVELAAAGKLQQTLTNEHVIKLIVKGKIHGKDIKYMRDLIANNYLQSIDLGEAQIIANSAYSYYQNYKTTKNVMGDYAFHGFRKLVATRLPQDITRIGSNAFSNSGLKSIVIPDKVTTIGEDAFAYCGDLKTVLVGKKVSSISKGAFYSSNIKDIYVTPLNPPSVGSYLLSSNPTIHVYASALSQYQASAWAEYGTIVGDLTDDIVDGVEEVEEFDNHENLSDATYDLMGRRVTDLRPGTIYIRNGKKFVIR